MDTNYAQKCPSCDNNSILTSQTEYEVEHFGAVLLSAAVCQRCGYRHSDVISLANREPVALTAKISSLEDLEYSVLSSPEPQQSASQNLEQPLLPGPYSEGYISNVEVPPREIEDALTFMLSTAKGKHPKRVRLC